MTPAPLSRATLGRLPAGVARPRYDPAEVSAGVVHLGFGGFHRAHMARYTHDLMDLDPAARAWGIAGAGLMPGDSAVAQALVPQDGLYTLVERDGVGEAVTVIGSVARVLDASGDTDALLDAIDAPGVRIVSLTVTEHGYGLDRATRVLDPHLPSIAADLRRPMRPRSPVGILVEGLRRRRASGRPAFTALSCDNIQHNGEVLRAAVLAFAGRSDPALAAWITRHGAFPSTMVDRITPATRPGDAAHVAKRFGVEDAWPIVCEPFRQWVIEDCFADGRPDWDRVGAQFVTDVAPYERMKLRLLNASHLAVAGLGRLMGLRLVDEAMREPLLRRYMRALMDRETGPALAPVPGVDLAAYKTTLIARFANPAIGDTVDRVNADAALNYLLDPLRDRLAAGAPFDLLALAVAAWMRRVRGVDEAGAPLAVSHPLAEELRRRAETGGLDPRPLLALRPLFGELGDNPRVVAALEQQLGEVYAKGASGALQTAASQFNF